MSTSSASTPTPANRLKPCSTHKALATLKKPLMIGEYGCGSPAPVKPRSCDYDALIRQIHATMPQVFALSVWSQSWALPEQNGMAPLIREPWIVTRNRMPRP